MEYTTVSGDTWDSIALKVLGSKKNTKELMDANKQHLEIVIFSSGIKLIVPEIVAEITNATDLPPWRL